MSLTGSMMPGHARKHDERESIALVRQHHESDPCATGIDNNSKKRARRRTGRPGAQPCFRRMRYVPSKNAWRYCTTVRRARSRKLAAVYDSETMRDEERDEGMRPMPHRHAFVTLDASPSSRATSSHASGPAVNTAAGPAHARGPSPLDATACPRASSSWRPRREMRRAGAGDTRSLPG